ncbi:CHAD domain-containing protein [Roseibium salinum]|nr:CHAD domain-containing protein [Roseibium salinum]
MEFFGCLYPRDRVKPFLKRMKKKLQDVFGYLNDVAMAEKLPQTYGTSGERQAIQAIGFVIGWHEAQSQAMWQHARGYWEDTRKTPKFWK